MRPQIEGESAKNVWTIKKRQNGGKTIASDDLRWIVMKATGALLTRDVVKGERNGEGRDNQIELNAIRRDCESVGTTLNAVPTTPWKQFDSSN
jgi:hypothetical protein